MIQKTYGIEHLVAWDAEINVGRARVNVHFSGGALTRYGVTPAEYSTSDRLMQHLIENSDYYKSGRIKLLRVIEVADDAAEKARKALEATRRAKAPSAEAASRPAAELPETETLIGDRAEAEAAGAEAGSTSPITGEEGGLSGEESGQAAGSLTEVEVSCLQDAHEYLKEHFGIATSRVRSYEKAQAAAAEHGIKFVGDKF